METTREVWGRRARKVSLFVLNCALAVALQAILAYGIQETSLETRVMSDAPLVDASALRDFIELCILIALVAALALAALWLLALARHRPAAPDEVSGMLGRIKAYFWGVILLLMALVMLLCLYGVLGRIFRPQAFLWVGLPLFLGFAGVFYAGSLIAAPKPIRPAIPLARFLVRMGLL